MVKDVSGTINYKLQAETEVVPTCAPSERNFSFVVSSFCFVFFCSLMNFGNKARRIVKAASFQPSHSSSGRDKPRRVVKASFQHASRPKSGRTRSSRLRSATFLVRSTTQFAGRRTRPQSASSR